MADGYLQDNREGEGDEEDEAEEVDGAIYKTVKDAVLFAIDVNHSMLQASQSARDGGSATAAALKCAYALMQQRIISNPKDMIGILLFGTKESKFHDTESGIQYPHCYLLADLDVPAAADVKRLKTLVEDEAASQKLLVPSEEPVSMANVLFCANQIFTTRAPNFSSRRLFLVTDQDNPHAGKKDLRSSAIVRAKDLFDLGVIIELFPISQPGHTFDRSRFYDDIVYRTGPEDPDAPAPTASSTDPLSGKDGISLLTALLTSINSKAVPRRTLFSNLTLELAPTLQISVSGYILIKRQEPQRSCYIWMEGETPQIALGKTLRTVSDESGPSAANDAMDVDETAPARTVDKVEIRKAFKFGGETVSFTPEEVSKLRNFGEPIIRVIGFKPRSMIPIWANVKPATFIYPSEDAFVGSTRTFAALHRSLLQKDKVGLAWYIARRNAAPVIAALVAGAEKLGDHDEQTMPPGIWIVPLPFADDIRQNPETTEPIVASDELINKMRVIIEQLQLPKGRYDPAKYPNPSLQWHYRVLQAIALEEDLPEKAEDKTIPRYRQIHKRAGEYVLDWGQELEKQYRAFQKMRVLDVGAAGNKRTASQSLSSHESRAKKHAPSGARDDRVQKLFANQSLHTLTVAELEDYAMRHDIANRPKHGSRKAQWIDAIETHLERKV